MGKSLFLSLVLMLAGLAANAQYAAKGTSQFGINYHLALPAGNFDDFMEGHNSYRGFTFDYRYFLNDKYALGGLTGWQIYGEKFDRETFPLEDGAVTAVHWKYTHHVPILLYGHYNIIDSDRLRFTAGLGIGPAMVRQELWLGLYEFTWKHWGFEMAPELALQFKVTEKFGFLFAPRYNVVFNGERANFEDEKNHFQVWDFRFGIYLNSIK